MEVTNAELQVVGGAKADIAAVAGFPHTAEGTATGEVATAPIVSKGPTSGEVNTTRSPALPQVGRAQSQPQIHPKYRGMASVPLASISFTPDMRRLTARRGGATQNGTFTGTGGSVQSDRSVVSAVMVYGDRGPQGSVGGTLLRREREVLDLDTSFRLGFRRDFRRRDPARGLDKLRQDYVYYNYRSKGCSILHEKPDDTMTVTYNHLFDFGDGSRFIRVDEGSARPNPSVIDPYTGSFKSLKRTSYLGRTGDQTVSSMDRLYPPAGSRRPKELRTVSVDVSRSLCVDDLRVYTFEKPVVIESIIAADSVNIATSREGIGSVVSQGKLRWCDVPQDLQNSFHEAEARFASTRDSMRAQGSAYESPGTEGAARPPAALSGLCDGIYRPAASAGVTLGAHPEETRVRTRPQQRQVEFTDETQEGGVDFTRSVQPPILMRKGDAAATDTLLPLVTKGSQEAQDSAGVGEAAWQRRMQTDRKYETSRLHYRRAHTMERTAETVPMGMTQWYTVK